MRSNIQFSIHSRIPRCNNNTMNNKETENLENELDEVKEALWTIAQHNKLARLIYDNILTVKVETCSTDKKK